LPSENLGIKQQKRRDIKRGMKNMTSDIKEMNRRDEINSQRQFK